VKGTVGCAVCAAISTVPFPIFGKRHGRLRPLLRHFDRAFPDFFAKGTVVHAACARDRALYPYSNIAFHASTKSSNR
ncbi:hypothetical protein, partial [Levyella massiliensis]|uniref:hypothetical protein n=1 Tax=Levyella massiliensis TaxID=938289 RepID=UPI0039995197